MKKLMVFLSVCAFSVAASANSSMNHAVHKDKKEIQKEEERLKKDKERVKKDEKKLMQEEEQLRKDESKKTSY